MSSNEVKNTARCATKGAHISEGQCPPLYMHQVSRLIVSNIESFKM